jgi:leucine dehydrogenase
MTLKSAGVRVPLGGGKMVVIGNPTTDKNEALYRFVADCINVFKGTYIAACDVGWNPQDLRALGALTPYVVQSETDECGDDTAEMTALGVAVGIRAVVKHFCPRDILAGYRFALQGVGNVGKRVGTHLYRSGAVRIFTCDVLAENVREFKKSFPREKYDVRDVIYAVPQHTIYTQAADIFVPCARGGILTEESIASLADHRSLAVAGSANNQPAEPVEKMVNLMHERGVLYAPDFVINAGGVIECAARVTGDYNAERTKERVLKIGPRLYDIFKRAEAANCSPHTIAMADAERILAEARAAKALRDAATSSPQ